MSKAASDKPAPPDAFSAAVDRMRETAKWIITLFAGLGAVLIAGTQLSSVGRLDPADDLWRLVTAGIAGLVALAALARIIWAATNVILAGEVTLAKLEEAEKRNSADPEIQWIREHELLGGFDTVARLRERRAAVLGSYAAYVTGESDEPPDADEMQRIGPVAARLGLITQRVAGGVRFHRVEQEFRRTRTTMFVAGGAAAAAVLVAVWALNPPPPGERGARFVGPAPGRMHLTTEGRDLLSPRLGAGCVGGEPVPVVVLGVEGGSYDVVVVPSERCRTARLSVTDGLGTVLAAERVALDSVAAADGGSP